MRTVRDRPMLLQRFPNGAGGSSFFQKRIPDSAPRWLQTTIVSTPNGTTSRAIVMADIAHVLWAANLGVPRVPPVAVSGRRSGEHRRAAHRPRPRSRASPTRWCRRPQPRRSICWRARHPLATSRPPATAACTSTCGWSRGGRRSHVRAAVAVARELERRRPELITANWWKEERGPRVFVDFNQNAPHKTVFGAWWVRARPGAQVSTPFAWDELDHDPARRADDRDRAAAPRASAATRGRRSTTSRSRSTPLVERYERDLAAGLPDAPWPPVYPKMPDEAPRVQPSRARKPD